MKNKESFSTLRQFTDEVKSYETSYRLGFPTISDYEYDMKFKELKAMEEELGMAFDDSPTMNVGSDLQKEFKKAKHRIPMQSIENVYSNEELVDWVKSIQNDLGSISTIFSVEPKYDGLAVSLIYKNGRLVQAITRGNQVEGDDVTANAYQIANIPKILPQKIDIDIRGEVLMTRSVFEELNKKREANGEKLFVNPRNACSGSLKQLDPKVTKERKLMFAGYAAYPIEDVQQDVHQEFDFNFDSQEEIIASLMRFGFHCYGIPFVANNIDDIVHYINEFEQIKNQKKLAYDCDGVVIKVNSRKAQEQLGLGTTAPKWVKARKYKPENQSTKINSVEFSVGTFGAITPVLNLDPIFISGTTVARATANNEDFIKNLGLHYGDKVFVEKSGEIIPKVIGLDEEYKNILIAQGTRGESIEFPKTCPCCGSTLVKDGAIWKCPNREGCLEQKVGRLVQFCSKNAMNIEGVGPAVARDLLESGLINGPIEIYNLLDIDTDTILQSLPEGYGHKTICNLKEQIENSYERPFSALLFGLCIDSLGKTTAKLIANSFKSYEGIMGASVADFASLEGIGEITAKKIINGLHNESDALYNAKRIGLKVEVEDYGLEDLGDYGKVLDGFTILFSGTSEHFDRDQTKAFYEKLGAKYASGVSKKLNYLIVGSSPGPSKVKKANDLGIEVISEKEFFEKYSLDFFLK